MYKYTIDPKIIRHFKLKHKNTKWSYTCRWAWYKYLSDQRLINIECNTQEEHRRADYIESMIGWFLPQNMVYYSKVKRTHIPVMGYLVEATPLFKIEKVD